MLIIQLRKGQIPDMLLGLQDYLWQSTPVKYALKIQNVATHIFISTLQGHIAAVDGDSTARDPSRLLRGEEENNFRDVAWCTKGHFLQGVLLERLRNY